MSRTAAASAAHDRARRARLRARAASEADSPCASPSRSTGRAARRREAAARDRGSRARSRRSAAARRSRRRTSELIVRERCGAARSGLRRLVLLLDELGIRRRRVGPQDRKSTRLNSSHVKISYAVFCLKKKTYRKEKS